MSDDDIFGAIAPAEMELLDTLVSRMQTLPAHRRIAVPLTVGNHVDHQLVRLAAERCFGTAALDYYEDYPYAQDDGAVAATIAAGGRLASGGHASLRRRPGNQDRGDPGVPFAVKHLLRR